MQLPLDVYPTNPLGNNVRFEGPEVVERFDPTTLPERDAPSLEPAQQQLFDMPNPAAPSRARGRKR
jgi:hypothetical protein